MYFKIHLSISAVETYYAGVCMLSRLVLCSSVYFFALVNYYKYKSTMAKESVLKISHFTL